MPSKKEVPNRLSGYKADAAPKISPVPNWDDFRIFMTVARTGSYRRAARELSLTQPSISNRIARFEIAIGVKLFDRTSRGTELTADGQRVLNHASAAEMSLSKAVSVVRDAADNAEGECKLGVGDGLGTGWLPRFLPAFLTHNPNINLSLFTTNDGAVSKKPLYDLQIQYQEPFDHDLVVSRIGDLHFTLFASRDYLDRFGVPTSIDDLAHHRVLDLSLALTDKGMLTVWAGLSNKTALFTNSSMALGEAVRAGSGIALLPTYAAAVDPDLIALMPQTHFQAPVYVCYDRQSASRPPVRATLNFLKNCIFDRGTMPWFGPAFHLPEPTWHKLFLSHLAHCLNPKSSKNEMQK